MTDQASVNQTTENKPSDKELNFRQLEARYERQLAQERAARIEAEKLAQERYNQQKASRDDDDEDDSEPYVDKKKLNKTLAKFSEQNKQQTLSEIQRAVQVAREEERKESWLENNPDFYDVLQNAEKLAERSPALARSILAMPEGFERQKLVYQSIKEMGLHKPAVREPTIQEKVDANRKSPYYQPSSVGSAPYASAGDFSGTGQKNAYDKMQELKNRLRLS